MRGYEIRMSRTSDGAARRRPGRRKTDVSRPERDDAYLPLEAPDLVPALSLLCFAGSVAARPLSGLLPRALRGYPYGALAPALLAAAFAILGVALGLVGLRRARRRALARLGLLLNGIVLGLSVLAAVGVAWILRR